jgi:hypothetical protein
MTYKQSFQGAFTFATQADRDAGLAAAEGYLKEVGRGTTLDFLYGAPMSDTKITFDQGGFFPASMYEEFESALVRLSEYATEGCVICSFDLDGASEIMICARGESNHGL